MKGSDVHMIGRMVGAVVVTLCGRTGKGLSTTNRYNGATCGKCRSASREAGK